ncbi:MAG: 50S ribosomal protein L21 [Desulfatiglandales bacterium]
MYAVISTGGKQYRVSPGDLVDVEKLDGERGQEVVFDQVLLLKEGEGIKVGNPVLEGVRVKGVVVRTAKARKVVVFKYKRRKGFKRLRGHRQWFTTVRISEILAQ